MRLFLLIALAVLVFAGSPAQAKSVMVYNPPIPVCGVGQPVMSDCPPIPYWPEAPIVICEEPAPWSWENWIKDYMYMFFGW